MADKKQLIRRPDEMPDHRAQLPHSSHSLSHGSAITATNGHLMPVYYDFLNAGEVVDLAIPFELITEPLVSYARAHLTVHTEFFFVPMQLLYQPFGDWYYNVKEQFSTQFEDAVRKLPLLNLEGVLDSVYENRANADFLSQECWGRRVARLFDLLDYPSNYIFMGPDYEFGDSDPLLYYSTFPYGLLAYNCIYEYFYRLDNRETFRPQLFNVDKFYSTGLIIPSNTDLLRMCSIKYRPLDNDYFTDMKVSPIVDVLNMNVQTELAVADSWLSRSSFTGAGSQVSPVLHSGSVGYDSGLQDGSVSPNLSTHNPSNSIQTQFGFTAFGRTGSNLVNGMDINTANIRAMFASEKLWSITGRAKKRYDDQTLAHFGFKVPHDPKHEISRFGHDVTPIDIGMVIATGASSETPLGEIAGKGRADLKNPKHHRFTAPCHGVVMAIMSIVPEIYYNKYRSKYTVVRSRDDLYTPEYDHLGMQPLFGYEEGYGIYTDSGGVEVDNASKIVGWQYRYEQWKRRFNKVSPAFNDYGVRKTWMVSRSAQVNPFVSSGFVNLPNTESFYSFLHSPLSANSIFVPQYSGLWSERFDENPTSAQMYDLDPYTITLDVQSSKLSTMSDYSLPRLDA